MSEVASAAAPVEEQLYSVAFPPLKELCDFTCGTKPVEIIETRYPAAVTLAAIAGSPELSNIIMDAHMEDFSTIMGDEEELSERIAFENSISTQSENENQIDSNYGPIIIGKSGIPVIDAAADSPVANINYTNLLAFIGNLGLGHESISKLNVLMIYLHVLIYGTFGIQVRPPVFIYSNILLVRNPVLQVDISSLMPKYSFNILCVKEPLLQTRLTAGRENGMGALLERFICKILQPFFDSITTPAQGFTKVKLIAPTESNSIWQIKLSVFENDFILVSLQIINVKEEYFVTDPVPLPFDRGLIKRIYTDLTEPEGPGWTINTDVKFDNVIMPIIGDALNEAREQLNPPPPIPSSVPTPVPPPDPNINLKNLLGYFSYNLCFSLYNKCLSKDFNCLCSLSDVDTKILKKIVSITIGVVDGFNNFYEFIKLFLNNLVDTLINKKKQYFLFGLLNLISCSYQDRYTLETKAYEVIFDKAAPNFNLFLESMRLIELVNRQCAAIPINIVMGGGKQYSLFQIALNNYFTAILEFDALFMEQQFPGIIEDLKHTNVKPAADADFGMFHPGNDDENSTETALGSTMCMSVCMLLQISLKKKIDSLFNQEPLAGNYDIDIGNSCIGNPPTTYPPTTLSSLRINLHSSYIFYTYVKESLDGVVAAAQAAAATPANNPAAVAARDATRILNFLTIDPFFRRIISDMTPIASVISPYDFVLKGSMKDYIVHILDAIYKFKPGGSGAALNYGQRLGIADILTPFMFTSQGFSSSLKGIFDIFYTLFIIENFANRSLVTQKINKELRRVSICAQVLYIHFIEIKALIDPVAAVANSVVDSEASADSKINKATSLLGSLSKKKADKESEAVKKIKISLKNVEEMSNLPRTIVHDRPVINKLKHHTDDMISCLSSMVTYGYNNNLLSSDRFSIIMNTYVKFVDHLIEIASTNKELLFHCLPNVPSLRALTKIESYFMDFLVYSSPTPPPFPPPAPPAPPPPGIPNQITVANSANIILRSLSCIPGVFDALTAMPQIVHSLYKNKLYAACRDTVNKSEGVIAIASAYQSFLWDKEKRSNIRLHEDTDETDTVCSPKFVNVLGIMEVLNSTRNAGLDILIDSLNPCWQDFPNPAHDLLNLNTVLVHPSTKLDDVEFNRIANNNLGRFLIFSWFITSIFGIKTKSKPSKILALGRTYLKLYVESYHTRLVPLQENVLFGCSFAISNVPVVQRGVTETDTERGEKNPFPCSDYRILCLTYSSFNIKAALDKYRESQDGYNLPEKGGYVTVRQIQIDGQQRNAPQVLGVLFLSQVFENTILQQLLERFSILPKGKQFTIKASSDMGMLLRVLKDLINNFRGRVINETTTQFATVCGDLVSQLFEGVKTHNKYTPSSHDVSKFKNFPQVNDDCTSKYFRTKWIIYLVRGMINSFRYSPEDAYILVYRSMKLFILLLKYLINEDEIGVKLPDYITYISQILSNDLSQAQLASAQTGVEIKQYITNPGVDINEYTSTKVNELIDSEYPQLNTESCQHVINMTETATQVQKQQQQQEQLQKADQQKPVVKTAVDLHQSQSTLYTESLTRTKSYDLAKKTYDSDSDALLKQVVPSIQRLAGLTTLLSSKVRVSPKKGDEVTSFKKKPGGAAAAARQGGGTIRIRNPHSPKKPNNHTRKNKYKRNNKNKNKKHKSSPKYRKVVPSSRSGSQSNRNKSKSKLPQKNVTFKRRMYNK